MMDGLALGETTPGPLIMVVAFIALWRYKQDIMRVIAACAAVGLVYTFAMGA